MMPDRARPFALGWLQALSAVGNMLAALVGIVLGKLKKRERSAAPGGSMFLIGLARPCWRSRSSCGSRSPSAGRPPPGRKSRSWRATPSTQHKLGSLAELFGDPRWRQNTIVGMLLAFSGVVGLWGIGFFSFDLVDLVFRKHFQGQGLLGAGDRRQADVLDGHHVAAAERRGFFGIYAFARITHHIGRRPAFAISFVLAVVTTAVHVLVPRRVLADLRVDPDHGLLPARALRRLRDLLPRAVPHPPAQHGHFVLLQRGPAGRRRRPVGLGS